MRRIFLVFFTIIFFSPPVQAGILQGIGVNLGPTIAVGSLSGSLNMGVDGNIFLYTSKILIPLEASLGITYQTKKEAEQTKLLMIPVTLSYIRHFRPARHSPFIKLGTGIVFEMVKRPIHSHNNLDPAFVAALGLKSRIGKRFSLRTELSYRFILQRYIEEAKYNGHFISFCVGIMYE